MGGTRTCVYGPVASRRLGVSLGVDVVPRKTCDYDCVYCQLGRTNLKTTRREPYVPAEIVLPQLERRLAEIPRPDYITVSGSGEPTLNSDLKRIIAGIKRIGGSPVAVITNGSLLGREQVAEACAGADLVMPSLDAADEETFQEINRPCAGIRLQEVVDGLVSFRKKYKIPMWLEVFVVQGINSSPEHVGRLGRLLEEIAPDKVHVNTVARPPAESFARAVNRDTLDSLAALLGPRAEAVGPPRKSIPPVPVLPDPSDILCLVERRPCTASDVSRALGMNYVEACKLLSEMEEAGLLSSGYHDGKIYYRRRKTGDAPPASSPASRPDPP